MHEPLKYATSQGATPDCAVVSFRVVLIMIHVCSPVKSFYKMAKLHCNYLKWMLSTG